MGRVIGALVKSVLNYSSADSLPSRLRRRRFGIFERLMIAGPCFAPSGGATQGRPRILDVGGTPKYWKRMGYDGDVTCINLGDYEGADGRITVLRGDARDLSRFRDGEFDVVHCNSVLEHVGGWDDQQRAAAELRRVGRRYFVQVPNRNFPIEPHFLFPGVQFLSESGRRFVARHWPWSASRMSGMAGDAVIADLVPIRLPDEAEMRRLFPDGHVWRERFLGLTKSLVLYR